MRNEKEIRKLASDMRDSVAAVAAVAAGKRDTSREALIVVAIAESVADALEWAAGDHNSVVGLAADLNGCDRAANARNN